MNCYGQTFNETWLSLGAKVTCGARYVNFYPNQFNKFASEWKKGDVDFAEALRDFDTESSRTVMQGLIAADALGKSNFDKCPFLKTVLGDHSCAQSYFHANWGISSDEWQNGQSGADNMNYSSYMFRAGLKTLTRNNITRLAGSPDFTCTRLRSPWPSIQGGQQLGPRNIVRAARTARAATGAGHLPAAQPVST